MTRKSYKLPVRVLTEHITKLEDMAVRADEPLVEVAARVLAAALESSEPIPAKDRMSALEFIEYIDKQRGSKSWSEDAILLSQAFDAYAKLAIRQTRPVPPPQGDAPDAEAYRVAIELLQIREDQIGEMIEQDTEYKANAERLARLVNDYIVYPPDTMTPALFRELHRLARKLAGEQE